MNGCDYSGIFVDEKAEGLCQITFSNGDVYQGYLKDGTKTGRGVLIIAPSGGRLDGFWQNDILLNTIASCCADIIINNG